MNNRFLGLIITVVIVAILGGAGFFLYQKGLLPFIGKKAQKPVAVKPAQPAEQQSAQAPLQQEQQKPQQSAEGKKPTPSQKPAPAPSQPQAKPAGKGVYSVQIGSFKSETNASALAKQFKDKGYDAFTYKAQKGKETIYRVLIGKYDNRKEALKLASEVRAKEKAKAIVVKE